jgi:hypothetical protein
VNIYSDLRSKLGLYQTNRQDIKKEKKTNVPDIVEAAGGTVLSNDAGSFLSLKNTMGSNTIMAAVTWGMYWIWTYSRF